MFRYLSRASTGKVLGCAAATAALAGVSSWQALADGGEGVASERKVCTDKLACHRNVPSPRIPIVLVSCGSFNPPTIMHLRMFDLATAALAERGFDVWGCYLSPVADAYGKKGLAPVQHRVEMCRLAAAGTDSVMVDTWEASQPGYTRTLQVLRHIASALESYMQPHLAQDTQQQQQQQETAPSPATASTSNAIHAHGLAAAANAAPKADAPAAAAHPSTSEPASNNSSGASSSNSDGGGAAAGQRLKPQVALLCGADLLASINQPGVWKDPDLILREHSIVCVCRAGTDVEDLLDEPNTLLSKYREYVLVVDEPVGNTISSSLVRWLLAGAKPVRYLVPDSVLAYIQQHGLYSTYTEEAGVLHI